MKEFTIDWTEINRPSRFVTFCFRFVTFCFRFVTFCFRFVITAVFFVNSPSVQVVVESPRRKMATAATSEEPNYPPETKGDFAAAVIRNEKRTKNGCAAFDIIPQCSPNTISVIKGAADIIGQKQEKIRKIQERVKFRLESYALANDSPRKGSPKKSEAAAVSLLSPTRKKKVIASSSPSSSNLFSSPSKVNKQQLEGLKTTFNIVVHIKGIRGLPDLLSSVNSYVVLESSSERNQHFKTQVVKNCLDPVFDEQFLFKSIDTRKTKFLRAHVYSKNLFVSDGYIGTSEIKLSNVDGCLNVGVADDENAAAENDFQEFPVLSKTNYQNGLMMLRVRKSFWAE